MAESKEELKSFLMKVKEESEKVDLMANEATDKELISKIYRQLMQLNTRKIRSCHPVLSFHHGKYMGKQWKQ